MTIPKENLLSDEPLTDASPIYQALWWIAKGEFKTGSEWDRAHDICQSDEGKKPYDWVHAPEINSDRQGKKEPEKCFQNFNSKNLPER